MAIKKAVFFTIDGLLASGIIITAIILVSNFYVSEHNDANVNYASQDLVRVFSFLTVGDVNNGYVKSLIASGDITNLNNTIIEQIGQFWSEDKIDLAKHFTKNLTEDIFPSGYGFSILVDNDIIYSTNFPIARSLVSSRRITSGITKAKPTEGYSARVLLNGVKSKTIKSYAYFGGYVGDGTITQYITLPNTYDNIINSYMEFAISSDFDLEINGMPSGSYLNKEINELMADKYNISSIYYSNFQPGQNKIKIIFNNQSKFIGGGFFRVSLNSTDVNYFPYNYDAATNIVTKKDYLTGVDGVINVYSSFYVPGNLNYINMQLNFTANYPLFVSFGNITVYEKNLTGILNVAITNSTFSSIFNGSYASLSSKTVPLRIGHFTTEKLGDFARRTDTFIATDISTSMDIQDVSDAPGQSRLDVAKTVEKNFVDFVFNKSLENRLGLVTYHSSVEPGQSQDLTNNNVTLKNKIDGYATKSVNTCFSCAIKFSQDKLVAQGNSSKKWAIILMSDGTADKCDAIPQSQCTIEAAINESIQYACNAYNNYNISIYAIGFGVGADNTTLKNISEDCSDGSFFHSINQSQLQKAFELIAEDVLSLTFTLQKTVAEGVSSTLDVGSYLEIKYTPEVSPLIFGKIPITLEQESFGNNITYGILNVSPNVTVTEALVTSYSGDKWTQNVSIQGNKVFDLSYYNRTYVELGDPFLVNIPAVLIQNGINNITIQTASGPPPSNGFGGSPDDRIIYTTLIKNSVSYSSVSAKADGCRWFIIFEDGTNTTINVPSTYTGSSTCDYQGNVYNINDSIDNAAYYLFSNLDIDKDGKLDVKIDENNLDISTITISKVPSLWGPAIIEINVWQ